MTLSQASATLREMSDIEAAWLGAMLDAEGNVAHHKRGNILVIVNSEIELLSACLRATGVGTVYPHNHSQRKSHWKYCYQWSVSQTLPIINICQRIAPWSLKAQEFLRARS